MEDILNLARRFFLGISLALIVIALIERGINLTDRSLLELVYPYGASRLFGFANTFLLAAIALGVREMRQRPGG
jgi:hypothetical protein